MSDVAKLKQGIDNAMDILEGLPEGFGFLVDDRVSEAFNILDDARTWVNDMAECERESADANPATQAVVVAGQDTGKGEDGISGGG